MGESQNIAPRYEAMSNGFTWPLIDDEKTPDLRNEILKIRMRPDDVIVASYPKAGTTWLQETVWLICNDADTVLAKNKMQEDRYIWLAKPARAMGNGFVELTTWPREQTRFIKTHLSFQLLPHEVQNEAVGKVIYVARNPKDNCVSFYHFHRMNKALPEPGSFGEFLARFTQGNLMFGSWFEHVNKYWQERPSSMHFVMYENMKRNCKEEIIKLANFLGKDLSDTQVDIIANHVSFENMKGNKSVNRSRNAENGVFDANMSKFMRKGQVGDWKNHFTVSQNEEFDELYRKTTKDWTLELDFEM